jgi:hypothetical protein
MALNIQLVALLGVPFPPEPVPGLPKLTSVLRKANDFQSEAGGVDESALLNLLARLLFRELTLLFAEVE